MTQEEAKKYFSNNLKINMKKIKAVSYFLQFFLFIYYYLNFLEK